MIRPLRSFDFGCGTSHSQRAAHTSHGSPWVPEHVRSDLIFFQLFTVIILVWLLGLLNIYSNVTTSYANRLRSKYRSLLVRWGHLNRTGAREGGLLPHLTSPHLGGTCRSSPFTMF